MKVLFDFLAFAVQAAPEVAETVTKLVKAFAEAHPELGPPPPEDNQAEIERQAGTTR